MSHAAAPPAAPLIGFGQVRHTRLRPRRHAFAYPTFFLMLPMRSLSGTHTPLAVNRGGAISFHDVDHGDADVGNHHRIPQACQRYREQLVDNLNAKQRLSPGSDVAIEDMKRDHCNAGEQYGCVDRGKNSPRRRISAPRLFGHSPVPAHHDQNRDEGNYVERKGYQKHRGAPALAWITDVTPGRITGVPRGIRVARLQSQEL